MKRDTLCMCIKMYIRQEEEEAVAVAEVVVVGMSFQYF